MFFERLPVDLIAEILGALDLDSLIQMSYVSKRFYLVASEPSLNPWRKPVMRNLRSHSYDPALKHLSVRTTVPRQNWIDILALASPSFILFEATLPNLKASEWEECFKRRFLPSWEKWKKETSWKEAFLKILHRVWHRSVSSCTTDEAWTKYIVLNRSGTANELEMSSRNYNPLTIFNEMKLQNNLSHLETRVRQLVLELSDVRILAFGVLVKPRSDFSVNPNAHLFLNPPGISPGSSGGNALSKLTQKNNSSGLIDDHGVYPCSSSMVPSVLFKEYRNPSATYRRLTHPEPAPSHANYPFYTPGGEDLRWLDLEEMEEKGLHWVGGLLITAQLIGSPRDTENLFGRNQYASFSWQDLWAIAPWMREAISKQINGAGLGN
ncbi:hypothetical protein CVT26_009477 [Gymnopilus dilepis]|uniref:F-box domain-containing protein n=1 Tax=Gymnopilus dilepis TaxID=231916 RepID=A0A409VK27_9AGAR|nr:hypothetical protein CVT26_009477 [Gymnopilus dilepis]